MSDNNSDKEQTSFVQRLIKIAPGDLIRLFFLSVAVGIVLAAFNVNPRRLWVDFFGTITESWSRFLEVIAHSAAWAVDYFLLGAILVIPIWLVLRILSATKRR